MRDSPPAYFRLVADGAVTDGDGAGLGQGFGRFPNDHGADKHHGAVGQLVTGRLHIGAVWLHLVDIKQNHLKCFRLMKLNLIL